MLFILRGDIFSSFYWIKVCLGINIGQRGLHKKEIRMGEMISERIVELVNKRKEKCSAHFQKGLLSWLTFSSQNSALFYTHRYEKKMAIMYANTLSDPAMSHLSEVGFINNGKNVPHDIH